MGMAAYSIIQPGCTPPHIAATSAILMMRNTAALMYINLIMMSLYLNDSRISCAIDKVMCF